jgi:hypothetical protein
LSDDRRTQHDADELVNLRCNLRVKTNKLKVTATMSALANHAFAHTVQRDQLDVIILARLFLLQFTQRFLERSEFANKDIRLVDFISDDD